MKTLILVLLCAAPAAASSGKSFLPSQAPISLRPSAEDARMIGVGYNHIVVTTDWKDDFFSGQLESIGQNEIKADNAAVGLLRSRGKRYSEEWDFIAGALAFRSKTSSYVSPLLNKSVNVGASGHGLNAGVRYAGAYSLAKRPLGGSGTVDWTFAGTLHAAYYRLNNSYHADSADGLDVSHYDATEQGFFLRPALAFEPILEFKRFALMPYAGVDTQILLSDEKYHTTRLVRSGVPRSAADSSDQLASVKDPSAILGFDVGLPSPFSSLDQVTLGGAVSRLFGAARGSDFVEMHVVYAFGLRPASK